MTKLNEDLAKLKQEPSSKAAEQAKKLNLQYVGFGRYEDPKTQQITHIVQNDKLVPFRRAVKTATFRQQNADDLGTYATLKQPEIQELHDALTKAHSADKFDDRELDALYTFTNAGYVDINDRLAKLPLDVPARQIEPISTDDRIADIIQSLDSAIKKSRAPKDFHTYASLGSDVDINSLKAGTSFRFKGYRSTSINVSSVTSALADPNAAMTPQKGRQQIALLQIQVKKNSRGLYVSDYSPNPEEAEFILPRGARIDVIGGPHKLVGSDAMTGNMNLEIVYLDCVTKG